MFPGAGGLDGGVEGQQVGLIGDRTDDLQDLLDLLAALCQLTDDARRLGQFIV